MIIHQLDNMRMNQDLVRKYGLYEWYWYTHVIKHPLLNIVYVNLKS